MAEPSTSPRSQPGSAAVPAGWQWLAIALAVVAIVLAVVLAIVVLREPPAAPSPSPAAPSASSAQPATRPAAGATAAATPPVVNPTPSATPPVPPPSAAAGVSQTQLDAARLAFLSRHDYLSMVGWLEKNVGKDSPLVDRYRKLNKLKTWLQIQVRATAKDAPLAIEQPSVQGPVRLEIWGSTAGKITMKGPQGMRELDFDQMAPWLTAALTTAALRRMPGTASSSLEYWEALRIYTEECDTVGLLPDR